MSDIQQESEVPWVFNLFNIATLDPTVDEGKASYVAQLTALPEGTHLYVSDTTYVALKNLLNLLCLEKATSRIDPNRLQEELLNQSFLTAQIELLQELLNRMTVK